MSVPDPRPAEPQVSTPAASVDPEIGDTPHRNDHVVADSSDRAPASSGSVAVAELTHTHIEATPETDLVTNDNGLIQRRPGKVFSTAAQAADAGAFKRLGDGAEDSSIDNVPPSSRFAALSRLQRGVTNARVPHTNPSDPSNTTDTEI